MLNEPKTPEMDTELTDEQLEQAAGGGGYKITVTKLTPGAGEKLTKFQKVTSGPERGTMVCTFDTFEEAETYTKILLYCGIKYKMTVL